MYIYIVHVLVLLEGEEGSEGEEGPGVRDEEFEEKKGTCVCICITGF